MKSYTGYLRAILPAGLCTLLAVSAVLLASCTEKTDSPVAVAQSAAPVAGFGTAKPAYPEAARGDIVDDYHGTKVADPYRWFEQLDSPQTKQWVEAENKVTRPILEKLPNREWLKQRLTQLWSYERFGVARKAGAHYYFTRNDGKQNQSVLYVSDDLASPGKALFDPNTALQDATISLADYTPSPNGDVVAYAVSDGGTDWQIWNFRRASDGKDIDAGLRRTKFWGVSWARDGSGVYYSLYPARADGKPDDAGRPDIYFHKLGEPQERDRFVYKVQNHPTRVPQADVTEDGRYLVITITDGDFLNGVDVLELGKPGAKPHPLFDKWDAYYTFIGGKGDELYFHTTRDAANARVIAVNAKKPDPAAWRTVVPAADMALESAHFVGGRIIATYLKDAHSLVRLFDPSGKQVGEVPLPGLGTTEGFRGESGDAETFFSYADYVTPASIFRLEPATNTVTPWRKADLAAKTDIYVTEQIFYNSKDGTRVPMFITHRRDMKKDGNQATLLYGYGGFNAAATPEFRAQFLAWLEMGGIIAEANLRGGGEYGEAWHIAGTRAQKQNVFDDFIAAAEYLISEKYTNPKRLAIHGRSNGGLLVGAVLLQRPELFGAALPTVGVLDMLRYHTASANARQWSTDYGLSENVDDFEAQYAYSPVHNVKEGVCYPPTLITTADHDDRVVPWHSFKFAAALQKAQGATPGCVNPVLIRIESRAGHSGAGGASKPVWMQIEDFADQWAFVAQALGMPVPSAAGS
ncbi:MAG: prolyl oligopeptidase family serine peptidase [Gammaproteobacteria bacterium]